MGSRLRRAAAAVAGLLLLGANALAAAHAHRMLVFQEGAPPAPARAAEVAALPAGARLRLLATGVPLPRPALTRGPDELGLGFETVRFAARDGTPLEAWWVPSPGARGAVVLLHGYRGARDQLLEVAAHFVGRGWSCLLVDARGSGGSGGQRTSLGWHEAQDAAAAVAIARERAPGRPVVLYGFSMGGAAALGAVAREGAPADGVIAEGTFSTLLRTVERRFSMMGAPTWPGAPLLVAWGGLWIGTNGFSHRPVADAGRAGVPMLFLHGEDDFSGPPEDGAALAAAAGARGTLVVLPRTPHHPGLHVRPVEWSTAVDRFLGGVLLAGAPPP
jgi:alpha-beta hydrolase superfamily lysophospholipase